MSRGEAYRRVTLVDEATGKIVEAPFLELDEELWSPDGTRFTLLFDPGRIKRGLKPREEVGPVLEARKSYSLVIDRQWVDAAGNALKSGIRKSFRVGPPDETSPDPTTWTIHSPVAGSRDPTSRPLSGTIKPGPTRSPGMGRERRGENVAGQISVGEAETLWRSTPASPWLAGGYRLVVGTELEDLAGNSVAQPFEVDAAGPISKNVTTKTIELPFGSPPGALTFHGSTGVRASPSRWSRFAGRNLRCPEDGSSRSSSRLLVARRPGSPCPGRSSREYRASCRILQGPRGRVPYQTARGAN